MRANLGLGLGIAGRALTLPDLDLSGRLLVATRAEDGHVLAHRRPGEGLLPLGLRRRLGLWLRRRGNDLVDRALALSTTDHGFGCFGRLLLLRQCRERKGNAARQGFLVKVRRRQVCKRSPVERIDCPLGFRCLDLDRGDGAFGLGLLGRSDGRRRLGRDVLLAAVVLLASSVLVVGDVQDPGRELHDVGEGVLEGILVYIEEPRLLRG